MPRDLPRTAGPGAAGTTAPAGSAVVTPGIGNDALSSERPIRDEPTARREVHLARLRQACAREDDPYLAASLAWAIAELGGVE